jgi:hypothetical protein
VGVHARIDEVDGEQAGILKRALHRAASASASKANPRS